MEAYAQDQIPHEPLWEIWTLLFSEDWHHFSLQHGHKTCTSSCQ